MVNRLSCIIFTYIHAHTNQVIQKSKENVQVTVSPMQWQDNSNQLNIVHFNIFEFVHF